MPWKIIHAREKNISDISYEEGRLSIVGNISSLNPLKISDNTGEVGLELDNNKKQEILQNLTLGQQVRVFCVTDKEKKKLRLEFFQDFSNIDKNLYEMLRKKERLLKL